MNERQQVTEKAKAALAEITRMSKENGGKITAEAVLAAARDSDNPLHDYFEWDDDKAAEKYRIMQARALIRCCRVEVTVNKREISLPYYKRDPDQEPAVQGYIETTRLRTKEDAAHDVITREFQRIGTLLKRARDLASYFDMEAELEDLSERFDIVRKRLDDLEINTSTAN